MQKTVWRKYVDETIAATGTSTAFDLPVADCYSILFDIGAGGGTSPTLDITMQFSPDDGTTYYNAPLRSAQITTSASKQMITFQPRLNGEAAWHNALADTGGALAKNFVPAFKCKFSWTAGGTSPSFVTKIYIGVNPLGSLK